MLNNHLGISWVTTSSMYFFTARYWLRMVCTTSSLRMAPISINLMIKFVKYSSTNYFIWTIEFYCIFMFLLLTGSLCEATYCFSWPSWVSYFLNTASCSLNVYSWNISRLFFSATSFSNFTISILCPLTRSKY